MRISMFIFLPGFFVAAGITVVIAEDPFLAVTLPHFGIHDVGILDLETENSSRLFLEGLVDPAGIGFDPEDGKLYFTDRVTGVIGRVYLNGTDQETLANFGNTTRLEQIALNPWSRLLFWADAAKGAIFVSNLEVTVWKKLIHQNLARPRGLLADNENSYIYWTEWLDEEINNQAKIERATMSGEDREVLVSDSIVWPNGIALDGQAGKLYWCDAYLDRIESVDLDGSNRTLLIERSAYLQHSYSLALFDDALYWSDARQRGIVKSSINGVNRSYSLLTVGENYGINGLAVSSYNIGDNACSRDNGGCFTTQLCLPKPSGRDCACLESRNDDNTCFYQSQGNVPPERVPGITIRGCPGDTKITLETDEDSITVMWLEPNAMTADGVDLTADQSHRPGDAFDVGTTTVIYVYEYNGRTSICSFDVTVTTTDEDGTSDDGTILPSYWMLVGIGVILVSLTIVFVGVFICLSCFPRKTKTSRRDGRMVAMEGIDNPNFNDSSTNTLTSHTSLTVNGSFRKASNKKKPTRKKNNRRNKKHAQKEVVLEIPTIHDYEEVHENRFVDGSTNFENSGRFNTMR